MLDKITNSEISEVNVKSTQGSRLLGTVPENKNVFDKFSDLIASKFNKTVDVLNSPEGAKNIQSTAVKEGGATNVQDALVELQAETELNSANRHNHENKGVLDTIVESVKKGYDSLVTLFTGIDAVEKKLTATDNKLPTSKAVNDAINQRVVDIGAGDMSKRTYDKNNSGIVDDAERLGGELKEYYASRGYVDTEMASIDYVDNLVNSVKASEETKTRYGAESIDAALLMNVQQISATVPASTWSATPSSDGWHTNRVDITEMKAVYNPQLDLIITSAANAENEKDAFGLIMEAETFDGYVVFKALDKPDMDFRVRFVGV